VKGGKHNSYILRNGIVKGSRSRASSGGPRTPFFKKKKDWDVQGKERDFSHDEKRGGGNPGLPQDRNGGEKGARD